MSNFSRFFLLSIVAAWAQCVAAPAEAQSSEPAKNREIEYAYPDQSVWTTRTDEKGDPENPLLRLATVLFEKAGIPWRGKRYPAARMFSYLNDGQEGGAEFSMLVNAPALKDCCILSKSPVATTELRVYHLPGKPPIRSKEDLAGKRVITIRGYSYGGLLTYLSDPANGITNNTAIKHDAGFAMLEAGRGDYLLDYTGPALEVMAARPIPGIQFETLSKLEVFMVIAKTYPDAANVMRRLEAIADTLNKEEIVGVPLR